MSGYDGEAQRIGDHFLAQWGNETPVARDNVAFEPPDNAPWVRLLVDGIDAFRTTIGVARLRHIGLITVEVFVPLGAGDGLAMQLADKASKTFRLANIPGIRWSRAPRVRRIGETDGRWHKVNAEVPFSRDENFEE